MESTRQPSPHSKKSANDLDSLVDFEDLQQDSGCSKLHYFLALIIPSVLIGMSNFGTTILYGLGLFVIGRTGSPVEVAGLGLSFFMASTFFYPSMEGVVQKVGIDCSRSFGMHNYPAMKVALIRGCLIFIAIAAAELVFVVAPLRSILELLSVDSSVAASTAYFVQLQFFFDLCVKFRYILMSFMISQGIEEGHMTHTLLSLAIALPVAYYLGLVKGLGFHGWLVGRAVFDLLVLAIQALELATANKVGGISLSNVLQAVRGIEDFALDSLLFSASVYVECLGWEISTFLVAQTKDVNQMGAYALLVNFTGIIWQIGNGFTATSRARLNYLLGNNQQQKAKELFGVIATGVVVSSVALSLSVRCFSHELAVLYAGSSPQMCEVLSKLLQIYSICLVGDFYYSFIFTIARTIDRVSLNLLLNVVFLVYCHFCVSLYLVKNHAGSCYTCLLVMQSFLLLIHVIMTTVAQLSDWSAVKLHIEDLPLLHSDIVSSIDEGKFYIKTTPLSL